MFPPSFLYPVNGTGGMQACCCIIVKGDVTHAKRLGDMGESGKDVVSRVVGLSHAPISL